MLLQAALFYSFLWLTYHCMYHHTFIHLSIYPSVTGHLGCFYVLAVVNTAAMNIGVHVSFQINFLLFREGEGSGVIGELGVNRYKLLPLE